MKSIIQKLENTIYGYDPSEFMPIFYDGEFDNRNAFIAYKMRKLVGKMIVLK